MTHVTNLDAAEISTWLTRITQTIDRALRDRAREEAVAAISVGVGTKVGLPVLAQLALLDDCLRVAQQAIEADGRVEADEIARVADLVRVAASKYFCVLPLYDSFGELHEAADVSRFLRTHRSDRGPFGYLDESRWRGLQLVRFVEEHARNSAATRDLERMLARIMDEVFAGRATDVERSARRKLRDLFEPPANDGDDPRVVAFCRADGPEVFSSVAHGSQIHVRDPFDVESIHREAREIFHQQLERAATPEHARHGQGRTLLVLGEAGSGKTHLLRALRTQTHTSRLGYVGYLQMSAEVGDYARYVLRNLIDSMECPYDPPAALESALVYLSDGLAEGRVEIPLDELEQLRTEELGPEQLEDLLGRMVDRVVRTEGLETFDTDLVQALLLLQRRDPAVQRRVVKYLRCEALNAYDRRLLGGLAARTEPEDPLRTIRQLAAMMNELHMAALVLMVDQLEETVPDGQTVTRLQQAFDTLRAVADSVPTAVVVIACLEDVYDAVRPKLSRSLVDRLERDPVPARLTSQREPEDIEEMLTRRLEYLYGAFDVGWRDDEPLFPFTRAHVDRVSKLRARDCLASFREYHAACIAERQIVALEARLAPAAPVAAPAHPPELERTWSDAVARAEEPSDDPDAVLDLVADGLRGAASELGLALTARRERDRLVVEGSGVGTRIVALCNRAPQGGHLGAQFDALRSAAVGGAIPIALRGSDFEFKPKTKVSQQLGALLAAGGRRVTYAQHELRALAAAHDLAGHAAFSEWRRVERPIARLAFVRELLDLEAVSEQPAPPASRLPPPAIASPVNPPASTQPSANARAKAAPRRASAPVLTADPDQIRLGATTTLRAEPVAIAVEQIKTHITFLGGTGSGKTTAALSVVEQLLERGISVLLVDRKGDLARYASRTWWSQPAPAPDLQRKAALAEHVRVALYTPGNGQGRPLRLPLIPALADATPQERTQLAQFAANALGAMMGYNAKSSTHNARRSVLQRAIQLHGDDGEVSLDALIETIDRPDPELFRSVGSLQRHFAGLSENLQTLRIQRGPLLAGDGDALDVAELLPPRGDRPRLTIINTSALSEVSLLQFWISRLLIELARLGRRRPSKTLQAAVFFDEADTYVPATGAPPTKEPMFDLLRRARSTGIGVLLATQNPGDFDYKARDNIATWLVGKVAQERAIDKMRNLLASYPNVGPRLATQPTGHFFVLSNGEAREVKCDRSLMSTEQLAEQEVAELARATEAI